MHALPEEDAFAVLGIVQEAFAQIASGIESYQREASDLLIRVGISHDRKGYRSPREDAAIMAESFGRDERVSLSVVVGSGDELPGLRDGLSMEFDPASELGGRLLSLGRAAYVAKVEAEAAALDAQIEELQRKRAQINVPAAQ